MRTHYDNDDGNAANHEVDAQPVENTVDGALDAPTVHVSSTPHETADSAVQCEETLATPEAAAASHRGDDGQNDDSAGADVQPKRTVLQGTNDGPPACGGATVEILCGAAQGDDPEVDALMAAMDNTEARHRAEDEDEEKPFPLRRELLPPTPLPMGSLPPVMAEWAEAQAVIVAGTPDLAALELLAFVGLAVQPLRDVEVWRQRRPTSLMVLGVAPSGSKKSSIFKILELPFREFERRLRQECGNGANDLLPEVLITNTTVAGLTKHLPRAVTGSQGVFLDEAAALLGSFALGRDQVAATLGSLSQLYDGTTTVVDRGGDGRRVIDRKRLSILMMGQLGPFQSLLASPLARQQGFLSRALMAAPAIVVRKKASEQALQEAEDVLRTYHQFISDALNAPLPVVPGTLNDLDPPPMLMSPEAQSVIDDFTAEVWAMHQALGAEDDLRSMTNKHPESAARLSAIFQLVEDLDAMTITRETAERACGIARYFLEETKRLVTPVKVDEHVATAERFLRYLAANRLTEVSRAQLQSSHVARGLTRKEFDPAVERLCESKWLTEERVRTRKGGREKRSYRLTAGALRALNYPGY